MRDRKEIFYVAHKVSGDPVANAYKAIEWIRWLTLNHPQRIYVAPWVAEVLAFSGEDIDAAFYDRVLTDDEEVVRRLDGILLVGGTLSVGMARELDSALEAGKKVVDWHEYATPRDVPAEFSL